MKSAETFYTKDWDEKAQSARRTRLRVVYEAGLQSEHGKCEEWSAECSPPVSYE
jgi:hypothetical protein